MRRDTNRDKLRALMTDYQWHHSREMERVAGWRFGARLWELAHDEGFTYEKRSVAEDMFEYRLIKEGQLALI